MSECKVISSVLFGTNVTVTTRILQQSAHIKIFQGSVMILLVSWFLLLWHYDGLHRPQGKFRQLLIKHHMLVLA